MLLTLLTSVWWLRMLLLWVQGGVCLPLNRNEVGGPLAVFTPHNVREGFHALGEHCCRLHAS